MIFASKNFSLLLQAIVASAVLARCLGEERGRGDRRGEEGRGEHRKRTERRGGVERREERGEGRREEEKRGQESTEDEMREQEIIGGEIAARERGEEGRNFSDIFHIPSYTFIYVNILSYTFK